jgi:hypothetical protein
LNRSLDFYVEHISVVVRHLFPYHVWERHLHRCRIVAPEVDEHRYRRGPRTRSALALHIAYRPARLVAHVTDVAVCDVALAVGANPDCEVACCLAGNVEKVFHDVFLSIKTSN